MSDSESYQPADESKYSIEEELKWLLNYANHKFDVEKLKQFILAAKSQSKEKGTIDNKKTTLDIWNSVAFHLMHYENESEKDSSVGQRFDFVGENKIDIEEKAGPGVGIKWSTKGQYNKQAGNQRYNNKCWTITHQYSNGGFGCIKSPDLRSVTARYYSDLIFDCCHYDKPTYLILSIHTSVFAPIDRFTVFVDEE